MTTITDEQFNRNIQRILAPAFGKSKKFLSPGEIRSSVGRGFPFSAFESAQKEIGLPQNQLSELIGIPSRTFARRKESQTLTPAESDRLYRVARILAFTVEVLGDFEKARIWLKSPNRGLGGEAPLSLLDTDIGAIQVEDALQQLKYGIHG